MCQTRYLQNKFCESGENFPADLISLIRESSVEVGSRRTACYGKPGAILFEAGIWLVICGQDLTSLARFSPIWDIKMVPRTATVAGDTPRQRQTKVVESQ